MTEKKVVTVYVRLDDGNENARVLSFARPEDIPQKDILEAPIYAAIDGNSVLVGVARDTEEPGSTLADALAEAERDLLKWMTKYGYEVEFA